MKHPSKGSHTRPIDSWWDYLWRFWKCQDVGLGGWTRPLEVCPWGLFHVPRTFLSPAYHKVKVHLTPWESKNPTSNQESKWILHSLNCLQWVFCRRIRKVANTSLESPRQVFLSSVNQYYTPRSCSMPTGYGGHSSVFCINLKKTYQPFIFFCLLHFAFDHKKEYERKENYRTTTKKKKTELKVNSEKAESMGSRGRLYVWKVTSEAQRSSSSWNQRLAVEAAPEHWLKPDTALPLLWVSCSGLVRSPG